MIEILWNLVSHRARRDDRGATATEYALLVGFVALAIVLGVTSFGTALSGVFTGFATRVGTLN